MIKMQNVTEYIFWFYIRVGEIKACAGLRLTYWNKSLLQFMVAPKMLLWFSYMHSEWAQCFTSLFYGKKRQRKSRRWWWNVKSISKSPFCLEPGFATLALLTFSADDPWLFEAALAVRSCPEPCRTFNRILGLYSTDINSTPPHLWLLKMSLDGPNALGKGN